ncbi:MAG: formate dehydrogenase subunit alpha [Syntrophales bacterium]
MDNKVRMNIDGKDIEATVGQTILEVARAQGIAIPTLCHYEGTTDVGACRVCVVEIENAKTLVPSCCTPVSPGMVITTSSPKVIAARKMIIELLWSSGDHNCLTCEKNGACELQDLIYQLGLEKPRFQIAPPGHKIEQTNAMIQRDLNKCILCGRCVRVCNEIQVNEVLDFSGRGARTKVGPAFAADYIDSICYFCGECVDACPVGALTFKQARFAGRPWELKKVRTTCPYCGVGCQMDLNIHNNRIVKVTGNRAYKQPNGGSLCVKGRFGLDFVGHPDRLKAPLLRREKGGEFTEASWNEAYDFIANRLGKIKAESGPDSIAGLSSARCANEENYLFQKFMRAVIGTNNVDHCARLCHSVTIAGMVAAFGSGAMTNSIEEIELADLLLVTGSNTTETHPVISSRIKRAVRQHGARLIVIDPREVDLVHYATLWLRQKPGTDVAVLNGIMNVIIAEGLYAQEYIAERTKGFETMAQTVAGYTPEKVEMISGVPAQDLRAAAHLYAKANRAAILFAMGITQHTTGTDNVKSCANLAMLCGNIGIEGGGVDPLRGQNNVQGACDMGALPNVFPSYQPVESLDARSTLEKAWDVSLSPKPGKTVMEMMEAAASGEIRALYVMGENPMLSDPDLTHVEKALKNLDLLIVQDIFLTETAQLADVVLPAACFAEKDGTFTNTERRVQRIRKAVQPPGQAKADLEIIAAIATKMGYPMPYQSSGAIMGEINSVAPIYGGITYARIEEEGLQWPCPSEDHPGTRFLHKDGFSRGLGLFHAVEYIPPAELPDQDYPFILSTGRVLYQYHTGTMTRRSAGSEELCPESLVEINPTDADGLGIANGQMVMVTSRRGRVRVKAKITNRSDQGTIFMNFHFHETAVNMLTNPALDPIGKIPEFKVCAVRVEAA